MSPMPQTPSVSVRPPAQESQLLDLVLRLKKHRMRRHALHIHLSDLAAAYQRDDYIRIATETFATLAGGIEGQLFILRNRDLVFVATAAPSETLAALTGRLKILFADDPLVRNQQEGQPDRFCTDYNFENDGAYEAFAALCQNLVKQADVKTTESPPPPPLMARAGRQIPIHPGILASLEQSLNMVDVSPLVRRQPVCTIFDKTPAMPLFEELYVSIDDLQAKAAPSIDLLANPWLFRYLTQTLDRRMMFMLIRDGLNISIPFSINLNVATVLSPEFSRLEAIVTPNFRGRLVIEMNKLDVFSDLGAFHFARDYLHDHGFRVCLDGLTHLTLPYYNRDRLGFDLVKLHWTPNSIDTMLDSITADLRNVIRETGQAHTILCRCDDERAISVGTDLGIVMFQGRAVDRRLRGEQK